MTTGHQARPYRLARAQAPWAIASFRWHEARRWRAAPRVLSLTYASGLNRAR